MVKKIFKTTNLERLYILKSPNIKKEELKKIVKATKNNNFRPYIDLYDYKFKLEYK